MRKDDTNYQIGQRIKRRRKELGIRSKDFAKMLGYEAPLSITNIEHGVYELNVSKLLRIAEALDVNIAYLLGETEIARAGEEYRTDIIDSLPDKITMSFGLKRKLEAQIKAIDGQIDTYMQELEETDSAPGKGEKKYDGHNKHSGRKGRN